MNNTFTEAVAVGVALLPRSRPIRITFEYSPGHTLILEEDALRMWWTEYVGMCALAARLEQAQQSGPAFPADYIREAFAKKEPDTEKKD